MNRQEYHHVREMIGIYDDICSKAEAVRQILEVYPDLAGVTLKEVKEYLLDRAAKFNSDIEKAMINEK